MYGSQPWGCAKKSSTDIIQTRQNNILRMITNAYRYMTNKEIHNVVKIEWVSEVIRANAIKHDKWLLNHTNVEAIQLLNITNELRRLKRTKPHELT